MIYPIKANKLKVTSKYGYREIKIDGKLVKGFHHGIDLNASPYNGNAEIVAVYDGKVTAVQKTGKQYGTGCFVRLKHNDGWYTLYYHMKTNTIPVKKGQKVKKGEKLGIIGKTGNATGVHLHFQIDKGTSETSINPYDYLFEGKDLFDKYQTGNYKTLYEMYVRERADKSSPAKKVKDITKDGKKHVKNKNANADAIYKKGTVFTANQIVEHDGEIWGKSPSGFICIKDKKTVYCKKC